MHMLSDNAIAWAAFRLQGGWKNILLTTIGYAATIVVTVLLMWQFATVPLGGAMYYLLVVLLIIQAGLLLIFSTSRVQAAVRRDVTSGMIESHRLMPLPPTHAVLGYVLGPTIQALAMALATLIVGAFVARAAGVDLPRWLVANFLLLELAVLSWVVMGTAALHNAQAAFLALFFVLPSAFNAEAVHTLPGVILLLPPLTGKTVLEMRGELELVHGGAFLLHGIIALVFIRAAARKYVRSDATALSPLMGLCLLACWSAASVIAMTYWPDVHPSALRWRVHGISGMSVVCTLVAGMLLAMAPLTAAVRAQPGSLRRRMWIDPLVPIGVVLATVAIAVVPAVYAQLWTNLSSHSADVAFTCVALATVAASASLVARAIYLHGWRAWFLLVLWLMLTCLGPIAYDAAQHALSGETEDFIPGAISHVSPLGAVHGIWVRGVRPGQFAVGGQLTVVALAGMLLLASYALYRMWARRTESPVPAALATSA
jgi:hypothetical protein